MSDLPDKLTQFRRQRPPEWKLPPGVSPGTWDYVHTPSIANDYDRFLQGTSLTKFDLSVVEDYLPQAASDGALIADLGCGTGRTRELVHRKGYRLLGIDLSQSMLIHFVQKSNRGANEVGGQDLCLRANLVTLDCLADCTIDHAVCLFSSLGMIRGAKNRRRALQHFYRILKPGGFFFLHVHNRWASLRDPGGIKHLARSWWRARRDPEFDFGDRVYGYRGLPNMFLHSYSRRALHSDLRQAGFESIKIVPLTIQGDKGLHWGWLGTSVRAGGFMAIARRSIRT